MILKGPGGFGRIVNFTMNVILGIMLSFYVLWTVQGIPGNEGLPLLTPVGFFVSLAQSMAVGYLVSDLFPAYSWGEALARIMHAKGVFAHVIASTVLGFVMATCISFILMWVNNIQLSGIEGVLALWTMVYPMILVGAIVLVAAFLPPVKKLAAAISGFNPEDIPFKQDAEGDLAGRVA